MGLLQPSGGTAAGNNLLESGKGCYDTEVRYHVLMRSSSTRFNVLVCRGSVFLEFAGRPVGEQCFNVDVFHRAGSTRKLNSTGTLTCQ